MLTKLWIKDFRNLKEQTLTFSNKTPFFVYGLNNQGKTNFLESFYFLATGKTLSDKQKENVIQFNKSECVLGGEFYHNQELFRLYTKLESNTPVQFYFNNSKQYNRKKTHKLLSIDYISADIIQLFKGSPEYRRRDLDRFCITLFPEYCGILRMYEGIIKQKNKALKDGTFSRVAHILNAQLVEYATQVTQYRINGLKKIELQLKPTLEPFYHILSESIELNYTITSIDTTTHETYASQLACKLRDNINKERQVGYSLYGAHKDDISISCNKKDLFLFYSRGINRTLAILYKWTQIEILSRLSHGEAIYLLDDSFAELAVDIKKKICDILVKNTQLIYTSVIKEDRELFDNAQCYHMQSGELHAENKRHLQAH